MKGLSFSEPMVKAWLEGRKDVTRRLMNPQPDPETTFFGVLSTATGISFWPCAGDPKDVEDWYSLSERDWKPRYIPGETVYIKETWGLFSIMGGQAKENVVYKADDPTNDSQKWRSPRAMPARSSRSKARIVSVRPERIQEITDDDAIREGVERTLRSYGKYAYRDYRGNPGAWFTGARESFATLWQTLHPGSWEKNEFVWRIELLRPKERKRSWKRKLLLVTTA